MFKKIIIISEKNNKNETKRSMEFLDKSVVPAILQCRHPSLNHISATTLIPRGTTTNTIKVYATHIDMRMEINQRRRIRAFQHGNNRVSNRTTDTPYDLHVAAYEGNVTRVQELVQWNKELIWSMDSKGNIPLHLAVEKGHNEVALYLIREFPQGSFALNHDEKSPLFVGVFEGRKALVENMLEHFVGVSNQGRSIIFAALATQDHEMIQIILKHRPEMIKSTNKEGWTPLSYAAYNGLTQIVNFFIETFPSIACKDVSYPIHKACLGGQIEVLKMFYSHYPRLFTKSDPNGLTVLHHAAKEPYNKLKDVVSYLLSLEESRKLVKMKDETNRTPFDLARYYRNDEVMQLLP